MVLITKNAFAARIKNLSRSMVFKVFDPGQRLHHVLMSGKVDLSHAEVKRFMSQYGYDDGAGHVVEVTEPPEPRGPRGPREKAARESSQPIIAGARRSMSHHTPPDEVDRNVNPTDYLDLPMRAAVLRFGDQNAFKDWTAAVYKLAQLKGLEEDQARKRGDHIKREVAENLVSMVDALQKSLLSDMVINLSHTVINLAKADASKSDIDNAIRDTVERSIQATKNQMVKLLRSN